MADAPQARTLAQQVAENIETVRQRRTAAIFELDSRFWHTEATKHALTILQDDTIGVEAWAKRGEAGAKSGTAPGGGGWDGWMKAGRIILDGIAEQVGEANTATLQNIQATADGMARDAERLGAKAAKVSRAVGAAVGETAAATVAPLTPILGMGLVGLLALVALKFGGKRG